MKATWRSLVFAGVPVLACVACICPPAKAQVVSSGYVSPGGLVGVGPYGYWNGVGYLDARYPLLAPRTFVGVPVVRVYPRPPVIVAAPLVVRRPYVNVRPYAGYYWHHGYVRRVWR
jgi:hypothetical protein